jgi:diguanylate cyclase (GGDEF)-like protein
MNVDLDNVKTDNDTLGHAAGDVLFVAVAARLRSAVRTVDTVARRSPAVPRATAVLVPQ